MATKTLGISVKVNRKVHREIEMLKDYLQHTLYADYIFCFFRILQVPAAYAPIDPDSPPALSTHFMRKCNLKYILVEKQQINVSVH